MMAEKETMAERIRGKKFSDLTEKEKARETFSALFEIIDMRYAGGGIRKRAGGKE